MDEQKLTDWFPPEVLPACAGVYEKEPPEGDSVKWFQYWDGKRWWYGEDTPEETAEKFESRRSKSWPTPRRWRGLAEPPLTGWFDPDTPPEREGVYEIEARDGFRHFAYWTPGHGWGFTYSAEAVGNHLRAIEMARFARGENGEFAPVRRWRGLAVQP